MKRNRYKDRNIDTWIPTSVWTHMRLLKRVLLVICKWIGEIFRCCFVYTFTMFKCGLATNAMLGTQTKTIMLKKSMKNIWQDKVV